MRIACIVLFGLVSSSLLAQVKQDSVRSKYVQRFPDKFFVWPVIKQRNLSFDVSQRTDNSRVLNYRPNNSFGIGLGFYLFEIAFEVITAIPLNEKNRATYGDSDVSDLQVNLLAKNFAATLFRQDYSGFYVTDPNQLVPTDEEFIKRPDIEMINTGLTGIYIFNNRKFSLRSAYNYSERQLKSGGSFVITGTLNHVQLQSDSTILGSGYNSFFPSGGSFNQMRYSTFGLAPGYTFSLVYRSFFLNTSLAIGPAHHWISYKPVGEREQFDISVNTYADVRVALGYNSQRFFAGMSYVSQSRDISFDDIRVTSNSSVFRILAGYRFREVGILKKRAVDFVPLEMVH